MVRRWRRARGTAAVEMLLSIPFLILFALAMFDFARGFRTRQQVARATRHVAWAAARHADWGAPAAPDANAVKSTHLRAFHTNVTRASDVMVTPKPGLPGVSTAVNAVSSLTGALTNIPLLGSLTDSIQSALDFSSGTLNMSSGTVSCNTPTHLRFFGENLGTGRISATHYVCLTSNMKSDTAKEEDTPADPRGWFDPWDEFMDWLRGMGIPI